MHILLSLAMGVLFLPSADLCLLRHLPEPGCLHPLHHQVNDAFCDVPTTLFVLVCVFVTFSACGTRMPGCLHPLRHQVSVTFCGMPAPLFVHVCALFALC